jgi:hypothetical protein
MSEHRRQSAFLMGLLEYDGSPETQVLRGQLRSAEHNERCLFSACRSVALIGLVGLLGLGYAAVLLPEFFDSSSHFLIQFFSALSLGSVICLAVFVGVWLWYRGIANKIRGHGREVVTRLLEDRFHPQPCRTSPVIGHAPYAPGSRGEPIRASEPTAVAPLQKAP